MIFVIQFMTFKYLGQEKYKPLCFRILLNCLKETIALFFYHPRSSEVAHSAELL